VVLLLLQKKSSYFLCLETKKVSKEPSPALLAELTNEVSKIQGCRTFWGSCFEACPRNTTRHASRGSNSVAYIKPSQQASKLSLSLQAGSFAKIAYKAIS
jgi:hypothetical protein